MDKIMAGLAERTYTSIEYFSRRPMLLVLELVHERLKR